MPCENCNGETTPGQTMCYQCQLDEKSRHVSERIAELTTEFGEPIPERSAQNLTAQTMRYVTLEALALTARTTAEHLKYATRAADVIMECPAVLNVPGLSQWVENLVGIYRRRT